MSTEATERVWNHSKQSGSALLILLALADQADAYGSCWPSVSAASERARVTERQGRRLLEQLEAAGELIIQRGTGRGNTSRYLVTPGMDAERIATGLVARFGMTPAEAVECARQCIARRDRAQKGDIQGKNVTPMSPFDEAERVTSSAQKGDIQRERVTSSALKADTAMSSFAPPIGWLVDHPFSNGEINQPTNHSACAADAACRDPAEAARTVALLTDPAVGVGQAKARDLAVRFGFEEVRRQVAAWWPQYQAGRVQAGLLIKRIEDRWGAPELSSEFKRSDLYRRHRTPAECQADAALEAELAAAHRAYRTPEASEPPEQDTPEGALRGLLAGVANVDLHDAAVSLVDDTVTIALPAHRVEYARHQYTRSITFALRSAGLAYALEFIPLPAPAQAAT